MIVCCERRQARANIGEHGRPVKRFAAIAIAVGRDQYLGFDLAEAVEHCDRAHVGRAHRPHCADARTSEEGNDRLGHVRQDRDDAVARAPRRARAWPRQHGRRPHAVRSMRPRATGRLRRRRRWLGHRSNVGTPGRRCSIAHRRTTRRRASCGARARVDTVGPRGYRETATAPTRTLRGPSPTRSTALRSRKNAARAHARATHGTR